MTDSLVEQFKTLGVSDPDQWASSQRDEGIDQIARATILRALADIVAEVPLTWGGQRKHGTPEVIAAAERIANLGIPEDDFALVLKATAWDVVFEMLSVFGGASEPELNPAEVSFTVRRTDDEEFEPVGDELMLHESWREVGAAVLGTEIVKA
jgi:hypothetical protein